MTLLTTTQPPSPSRGLGVGLSAREELQLELLEELPARLEPEALAAIVSLHEQGETLGEISERVSLSVVVVALELRRELQRRARQAEPETPGQEASLSRLTRREWNKLARGSHVPNQPVREMLATALRSRPWLSERSVLADAQIRDLTQGRRLLGVTPYAGSTRATQTISCERGGQYRSCARPRAEGGARPMTPSSKSTSPPGSALGIPYTALDGAKRQALIALDATGVWFVYDTPFVTRGVKTGLVVDRLDGAGEGLPEAVALAVEYVADQCAYTRGERLESPLPRETEERLVKIRRDAKRAAQAAAGDAKTLAEPDWFQRAGGEVTARAAGGLAAIAA
ncbi:MAG: hypothetical protein ABSH36_02585 [Solirubrobacteraceae bacterium]